MGKEVKVTVKKLAAEEDTHKDYTLKWEDQFNGDSLDRDSWNVELHEPGWVNNELQEYVDSSENIYIKDGNLVLKPVKTIGSDGKVSYTSGRVNTQNKHNFKYGLFEARAKVPAGQGFLPAFWMMPANENLYGQWQDVVKLILWKYLAMIQRLHMAQSTMATHIARARENIH